MPAGALRPAPQEGLSGYTVSLIEAGRGNIDHARERAATGLEQAEAERDWTSAALCPVGARPVPGPYGREKLAPILSLLPPGCQQLLALLIHDPALSYAEISARLGIPAGSIGPGRRRCLDKLRHHSAITALINAGT